MELAINAEMKDKLSTIRQDTHTLHPSSTNLDPPHPTTDNVPKTSSFNYCHFIEECKFFICILFQISWLPSILVLHTFLTEEGWNSVVQWWWACSVTAVIVVPFSIMVWPQHHAVLHTNFIWLTCCPIYITPRRSIAPHKSSKPQAANPDILL